MVKGLRERQYQLAAQKRNEAHLRFNYYSQIAGYFERECAITRQFNSWVAKDSETSSSYLEKKVKEKKLQARQEKLRQLLDDEERQFRQECEDLARNRRQQLQRHEAPALEALRQKLLERKDEHNLKLPSSSRRRHQSYFFNSDSLIDPLQKPNSAKARHSESKMSLKGTCFDNRMLKSPVENESFLQSSQSNQSFQNERSNSSITYSRNIRRTLEETNLRNEGRENNASDVVDFANELNVSANRHNEPETIVEEPYPLTQEDHEYANKKDSSNDSQSESQTPIEMNKTKDPEEIEVDVMATSSKHQVLFPQSQKDCHSYKYFSKVDNKDAKDSFEHWQSEKSLPWSRMGDDREQNLSIPMFLYLTHNDMKTKILDLGRRELQACRGYRWEEALRLRDMRNRLDLSRENHLLNAAGLDLDEETRSVGLKSIEDRERILREREKICSNGTLYSEEAKDLWQKWVEEDQKLQADQAYIQRERLMTNLEDEWKTMALEDKNRIAHLYEKTKKDSSA